MTTKVLTIPPLLFGLTGLANPLMTAICQSWATSAGRYHSLVPTKASLARDAITGGAVMLDRYIRFAASADNIVVLGLSQGCQVASVWLQNNDDVDPTKLRFVLLGNPQRGKDFGAKGGAKWAGKPLPDTRNDSLYTVWDIARTGDSWAHPTGVSNGNAIHMNYNNTDLDTLEADKLTKTVVGNTSYYVVP